MTLPVMPFVHGSVRRGSHTRELARHKRLRSTSHEEPDRESQETPPHDLQYTIARHAAMRACA